MKPEYAFPPLPELVAHRGASHQAPENTLQAYRLAWQEGARWIEGDFQLTADREIVCFHDPDSARTAPDQPPLTITSASLAELRRLDVGSWKSGDFAGARIPTLDEILSEMPTGTGIYIEIKEEAPNLPDIVPALAEALAASTIAPELVTVISFSPEALARVGRTCPALRTLLLCELEWDEKSRKALPGVEEIVTLATGCGALGLGMGNSHLIDAALVEGLRKAGLQFHVWTVNAVEEALRYIELGVDSLTTDRPQGLRRELEQALGHR